MLKNHLGVSSHHSTLMQLTSIHDAPPPLTLSAAPIIYDDIILMTVTPSVANIAGWFPRRLCETMDELARVMTPHTRRDRASAQRRARPSYAARGRAVRQR